MVTRVPIVVTFVALALSPLTSARADEIDDELARRYVEVFRDTRLSRTTRVAAVKTLGALGPRAAAAVPALVAQLGRLESTELEPLQIAVIETLGEIGAASRAVLPSLTRCSGRSTDIDQAIKRATTTILASGESLDPAHLRRQLASADASVRLRAVKAIAGSPTAGGTLATDLRTSLTDADGDVRRAAQSLAVRLGPGIVPATDLAASYARDLAHPDSIFRLAALKRLAGLGKAAAAVAPAVEPLLTGDADRDVRRAAAEALTAFAGP